MRLMHHQEHHLGHQAPRLIVGSMLICMAMHKKYSNWDFLYTSNPSYFPTNVLWRRLNTSVKKRLISLHGTWTSRRAIPSKGTH